MSKSRHLVSIEYFKIHQKYLHACYEKHKRNELIFDSLPPYSINRNDGANNRIVDARYYHQFSVCFPDSESFTFLNLNGIDTISQENMSVDGYEEFFKDYDFEKVLSVFKPTIVDDGLKLMNPKMNYIVLEFEFIQYNDIEGYVEFDFNYDIIGYLDDNLLFKEYDFKIKKDE